MNDLIDRQAALDALIFDVRADRQNGKTLMVRYAEEVIKRIKELPSAQLAQDLPNGCTDTISRQAAVKALEETKQSDPFNRYEYQNIGIDWSIDTIKALPPAQRWIPCSERMPFVDEYGKSDQVLATCGLQGAEASSIRWLRILYFNGCNWCFPTGESYEQMVYAWMPLPEPYREERTEE